ncbi:HNH endonuclease family protein [Krasilnikovia sp. M28-CT-15]|uniref:HNH endonuclease family protein n=1 Tax=Krasilnikovia sp. M28-CT-15 TaxID=3373540 RepID=UPI0038761505
MSRTPRWVVHLASLTALTLTVTVGAASAADATPSGIPSTSTARAELDALTVAPQGPTSGYSRDLFPHWITISGSCNTRETVLKRDGTSVVTDASCAAVSGSWYSPYDGATWHAAADLDIDHLVPLAEAWRSGANAWSTSRRQAFANDLSHPELIAVTDNVNQAKGDQDPSTWQPSVYSYRCTYAKMWIAVKYSWDLTVQATEESALRGMLDTCTA